MPQRAGAEAARRATSFAARCADDRAFSDWYDTALPRVYGFIHGRTGGDSSLAEDITAQAFLEAIRARHTFDGRSDPVTWICSIARNRLIDHYRAEARDRGRHLRLVVTDLTADQQAWWDGVDDRDAVLTALAALPPIERTALTLRYLDGYSVRDTARLIGRTEAATESLLVRARDRVRAAFPGGLG
ncbi:MAG TPA: RNA polymerase sigma factor [Candidatus Limnocylindrales bacterium]|nr:RNA polymerase sigma factor [Candidatus Limnocylindrales bacterium]